MKQLLFALLFIPTLIFAQDNQRYLAGAVPTQDGKVVFTKELSVPSFNQDQIYEQILRWALDTFNTDDRRVVYQDKEKGEIAIIGKEYLVFSSTALSLDRALINYKLIIECKDHACLMELSGIRYEYNVTYQREPEKYQAEEWITDQYALNKSKTKLNRISGKFRKGTIDFAEKAFDSAAKALGAQLLSVTASAAPAAQVNVVAATPLVPAQRITEPQPATAAPMEGFVSFQADKVPETIIQMLPDNALLVKAGKDLNVSDANAQWKGLGNMFGKPISTISLPANSPAYKAIGGNDTYRLSFSKPGASADSPWIIIECRKQGETSEGQQTTIIGEILNVWIK